MIFPSDVEEEIFCAAASARGVAVGLVVEAVPPAGNAVDAAGV